MVPGALKERLGSLARALVGSRKVPLPGPPAEERGGGFGRRGGGGGPFGGGNRGRLTFSLTDTITFVDKVTIAPGLKLDYLHGDAAGQTGGTPNHLVEAQAGYFNNGLGERLSGNWRSGSNVDTLTGDNLRFSRSQRSTCGCLPTRAIFQRLL